MHEPRDYPYYIGAFAEIDVRNWSTEKVGTKLAEQRAIVHLEPLGFDAVKRSIAVLEYEMYLRRK